MSRLAFVGLLALPAGIGLGALVSSASGAGSGEPLFHDNGAAIFNFVAVGTTSEAKNVTVSNGGEGELEITGIAVTNTKDFSIVADGCTGVPLSSGQSCTVSVVFHPSDVGTRFGSLVFTEARSECKNYVAMAGSGTKAEAPAAANAAACSGPPVSTEITVTVPGQTESVGAHGTGSTAEVDALQLVAPPRCVSGRHIRLDLHTSKADEIVTAQVFINGHLDKMVRGPDVSIVTSDLPHRGLPRYRIQVIAGMATGGTLGLTRYFYTCHSTRSSHAKKR